MDTYFTISKFGVDDAQIATEEAIEPHSHDYDELLIGVEGQIEHFIDFRTHVYDAPFVSFITDGKLHRLRPIAKDGRCFIWVLRFKRDFIAETAFRIYASFHARADLEMPLGGCFDRLNTLCSMIADEYARADADFAIVRQLLSTLLCMIEAERKRATATEDAMQIVQNKTFGSFLRILEAHFCEPHTVEFYADKLFMTSRNLNIVCQRVVRQSVSEIIETRKLLEAKHLLLTTDKTISEIGYALGFNEKTYFTHVFTKKEGMTPTQFRNEMRQLIGG